MLDTFSGQMTVDAKDFTWDELRFLQEERMKHIKEVRRITQESASEAAKQTNQDPVYTEQVKTADGYSERLKQLRDPTRALNRVIHQTVKPKKQK